MAPSTTNPTTTSEDHTISLINATVATTTIAVNHRLDALFNVISSPLTGDNEIDGMLNGIRTELDMLASKQTNEEGKIKRLLDEVLNTEVLQHITREIEAEVDRSIETTVAALVEEELEKFIPKEIRQKADEQQLHIQQLHIQIHNSEARRVNSSIRTPKQFGENLQPLVNNRGIKSDAFPKTVKDLQELGAGKVVELVRFYGMEVPNQTSKVPNVNWFLREIGVAYQPNFLG